jgi:hypothetical protein
MAKVTDNNIVLVETEKIVFPNSELTEDSTGTLIVSNADASKIKGITVDDSAIGDGKALAYDQASGFLKYIDVGGAVLNRIQFTYTNIDNGQTTGTSTISEIDLDNTIPIWAGCVTNYPDPQTLAYIEPISTTQIRATRDGSPSAFTTVNSYWMEFEPGFIKSIDYGIFTIGSGNLYQIINVSEFDPSKTMLVHLGYTVSNNTTEQHSATRMNFNSTTSIICYRSGSAYTSYSSYALVEFN